MSDSESLKKPGPGQYTIPEKIIEGPKFPFGLKVSSSLANLSARDLPGPG